MAAVNVLFKAMTEAELRHWVEENPGSVNATDRNGLTPLYAAVSCLKSLALSIWLVYEMGADVDAPSSDNTTPVHEAGNVAMLSALLKRGADPTLGSAEGGLPLMLHVIYRKSDCVERLLQEPHVLASINRQMIENVHRGEGEGRVINWKGLTALHGLRHQNRKCAYREAPPPSWGQPSARKYVWKYASRPASRMPFHQSRRHFSPRGRGGGASAYLPPRQGPPSDRYQPCACLGRRLLSRVDARGDDACGLDEDTV